MLKVLAWDDPYLSDEEFLCLTRGRELITPFENWTQGKMARNAQNDEVMPNSPDATMWCAHGALACYAPGINRYDEGILTMKCKLRLDEEVKAAKIRDNRMRTERTLTISTYFYGIEVYNDQGHDFYEAKRHDLHRNILQMFDRAIAHRRHEINDEKESAKEPELVGAESTLYQH